MNIYRKTVHHWKHLIPRGYAADCFMADPIKTVIVCYPAVDWWEDYQYLGSWDGRKWVRA